MLTSPINRPELIITMGDPFGIGPEVIMKALSKIDLEECICLLVGDEKVLRQNNDKFFGEEIFLLESYDKLCKADGSLFILDPGPPLENVQPQVPTREGIEKTLKSLDYAIKLMRNEKFLNIPKAIITAPLNKEQISNISPGFIGHTEYLQEAYGVNHVTMVLSGKTLNVVPVTRHIPISAVSKKLTKELLENTLKHVIENRKTISGKVDAKIGVCALNPHAGEGGKIGKEEIDIIIPVVEKFKSKYENISGPLPADVVFYKAMKGNFDIIVAMYHDQGLGPFKMIDFDNGVNLTLGLGQIRTSPDHGTAYDIAGKGIASSGSMEFAINLAKRAITRG